MDKVIKITSGSFSYKAKEVFSNLNLQIPYKSVTCILGESGCGKTTLLKLISKRLRLKNGTIENAPCKGNFSFAYQDIRLIPHLTAVQNIEYVLPDKIPSSEKRKKNLFYLDALGISNSAYLFPNELSGGMQRRVGLARALVPPSSFLLLDEAFDSLDDKNKYKVADVFSTLTKQEDRTIICVTHDTVLAKKIADNIIFLKG